MSAVEAPPLPQSQPQDERTLTILEHLQELRNRLMICAAALVTAMIASFSIAGAGLCLFFLLLIGASKIDSTWKKWLAVLATLALAAGAIYSYFLIPEFWNTAATTEAIKWLKKPAESRVENFSLVFTDPLEFWSTFFQVSLLVGLAISMPVILWQIFGFISPGLTRNERRWAYPIVFGASAAFVGGCLFAYYVEMPPALNFLLKPPSDLADPLISVKKYVGFATKLMFVTGIVFETPFVVMGLAKVGIVNSRKLLRWWRFAIVGAFVLSAIVTPSIDPITQTLVAAPMIVLYFVGIALAKLVEKTPLIPPA